MFFEALNYETIEQKKAYEVAGLLGNTTHSSMNVFCFISTLSLNHKYMYVAGDIGGQMGLFIGASILTILELFDYAYEVKRTGSRFTLPFALMNMPRHGKTQSIHVFRDTRTQNPPRHSDSCWRHQSVSGVG